MNKLTLPQPMRSMVSSYWHLLDLVQVVAMMGHWVLKIYPNYRGLINIYINYLFLPFPIKLFYLDCPNRCHADWRNVCASFSLCRPYNCIMGMFWRDHFGPRARFGNGLASQFVAETRDYILDSGMVMSSCGL